MGALRALEILSVNGHLTIPNPPICIYRLTCIPTGDFYIGCSTGIDLRTTHHLNTIMQNIQEGGAEPEGLHFHKVISPILTNLLKSSKHPTKRAKFVKANLGLDILAIVNLKEDAVFFERYYIRKYIGDPKCCNVRCDG